MLVTALQVEVAAVVVVATAVVVASVAAAVVVAAEVVKPATLVAGSVICPVTALLAVVRNATTVVNKAISLATALPSRLKRESATDASNLAISSLLAPTKQSLSDELQREFRRDITIYQFLSVDQTHLMHFSQASSISSRNVKAPESAITAPCLVNELPRT